MRRLPLLVLLVAAAVAATVAASQAFAAAPAKPGAKCKNAGARSGTLTCKRAGKALVWTRTPAPRSAAPRPATTTAAAATACSPNEPPRLKNIGVALGPFDAATATAGAFRFTRGSLNQKRVFMGFGHVIPNAQNGPKTNPQPTFILPQGTPVLAMIDG